MLLPRETGEALHDNRNNECVINKTLTTAAQETSC